MANFFDQFDAPDAPAAAPAADGNFFDQFDEAPPPPSAAAAAAAPMDLRAMSKDQLMDAYRTLPRDDPRREEVKRILVAGTDVPVMNAAQSAVAGATDAMSFGLSDEINAGIARLTGGDYNTELNAQRQMMRNAEGSNPGYYAGGQIAGGLVQAAATGGGSLVGATRALPAATRIGRVVQTAGNIAKPAATAGASGAVYGFNSGEGGFDERLQNAKDVGTVSAVMGPIANVAAKTIGKTANKVMGQSAIWSSKELEDMSQRLYRQATQEGAMVRPNTIANVGYHMNAQVVNDINYSPNIPEGFTAARKAMDIVDRAFISKGPRVSRATGQTTVGTPASLEEMEIVRRRLTKLAGQTNDDDEARMIFKMRATLDDAIGQLTPADMANGSKSAFKTLGEARKLWNVKSQTEWSETMLNRANNRAGQFSISKMENAIRTEARNAANNAKTMRRMPDEVVKATEKVANPGMAQNSVRNLAKFAPFAGPYGATISAIAPQFGLPLMAAGQVAQVASNRLTKKNFRKLQEVIQRSMSPKDVPIPVGEQIARRAIPFTLPGLLSEDGR